MSKFIFLIISFIFCSNVSATEQIKDSLVYNGKGYYIENKFLHEEILNQFVIDEGYITDEYFYTALWRGYMAVWEVENNKLQLKDLKSFVFNENDSLSYLKSVINDNIKEKINSILLNEVLIFSDYNDNYWDEKTPEEADYFVFGIENNLVAQSFKFNLIELENFKTEQFLKFKKTKKFKEELKDCKKFRKEQIKHYSKSDQLDFNFEGLDESARKKIRNSFIRNYKTMDCNDFVKGQMFSLWPSFDIYHKI